MSRAEYSFTLILGSQPEMTEAVADALYAAGCDDGSIAASGGVARIYFHRVADTLGQAIASAIQNVETAGCQVVRLELDAGELTQLEGFEHAA